MGHEFIILIADRNRYVREFLRRELAAEGYDVRTARDGREVMTVIDGDVPPDLLILDLEIPYVNGLTIIESLLGRVPPLPVVVHTFLTEDEGRLSASEGAAFVEKSGNINLLKAAVSDMLRRFYPDRFSGEGKTGSEESEETGGPSEG